MRKRKIIKICALVISLWIVFVIGRGFYWYCLDGKNISMTISSQHSETSTDIEVYINNELVFKDEEYLSFYQYASIKYPFGICELKVIVDKKEYIRHFVLFPVKFLYIEVTKDQLWYDESGKASVMIDISSSPIGMM